MEGLRKLSYEELNKLEKEAEKGWRNIHKVKEEAFSSRLKTMQRKHKELMEENSRLRKELIRMRPYDHGLQVQEDEEEDKEADEEEDEEENCNGSLVQSSCFNSGGVGGDMEMKKKLTAADQGSDLCTIGDNNELLQLRLSSSFFNPHKYTASDHGAADSQESASNVDQDELN